MWNLFPFIPHISLLFRVSALFARTPRSYRLSWLFHLTQRTTLVLRWVQFWFGLETTMKPKHAKNSQCKALNQSCCLFEPFYARTQDTYHYVYGQSNLGISPAHDLSYLFRDFNDLFPCTIPFCFTFSICLILSIFRLTVGLLLILWHALILWFKIPLFFFFSSLMVYVIVIFFQQLWNHKTNTLSLCKASAQADKLPVLCHLL